MLPSHLIVGLGNPGPEYAGTRHNAGFMAVDAMAEHYACPAWKKKFKGLITTAASERSSLLLKPQTFMNLSGESVGEALRYQQLAPENVVVFHDDLDLPAGEIRVKQGGGHGGHNGLKSIDAHIGKDYWRVRIGIGRPAGADTGADKDEAITDYVLGDFAKADRQWLAPLLDGLAAELGYLLNNDALTYAKRLKNSDRI